MKNIAIIGGADTRTAFAQQLMKDNDDIKVVFVDEPEHDMKTIVEKTYLFKKPPEIPLGNYGNNTIPKSCKKGRHSFKPGTNICVSCGYESKIHY